MSFSVNSKVEGYDVKSHVRTRAPEIAYAGGAVLPWPAALQIWSQTTWHSPVPKYFGVFRGLFSSYFQGKEISSMVDLTTVELYQVMVH